MTTVVRRSLLTGAGRASGPTVVIDVFRAFSTAAFALAGGARRLVLAGELDEARKLARGLGGALLMGEDLGDPPPDFHLGNSPAQVWRYRLGGATVVHRTSAGTRAIMAALAGGANPVYAGSFVVAGATVRALSDLPGVTLVAAGDIGSEPSDEDERCADYIEALLSGGSPRAAPFLDDAYAGKGGRRLRTGGSPGIDPADVGLCLAVDLFDFAMKVDEGDGLVSLRRHQA